jgi:hypothetical protein
MYIPFEELRAESRVWVYQGKRALSASEHEAVSKILHSFCSQWAAHGQPLKTSFKIEKAQFIVMAVDEDFHNPSGCSIDSSVGVLRQIQSAIGVDFLDRSVVPFLLNNQVTLVPLTEIKAAFTSGRLPSNSITLNTLAVTKSEFEIHWQIPAEKSWMVKYLPKTTLSQ